MNTLGKLLIAIGVSFVLLGILVYLGSKFGLSPGRLSGDIWMERPTGRLLIPLGTSLLISIILTIALNILLRILRK